MLPALDASVFWPSSPLGQWWSWCLADESQGSAVVFRLFPICRIGTVQLPSNVSMGFVFCFLICYHFVLYLDFGFCSVSESYVTFKISNLFVFGCTGSSLLDTGFFCLWRVAVIRESCGARAPLIVAERGLLSSWAPQVGGTLAQLPCGMWNLPGPGIEPVSPALPGIFLTSGPPGKSRLCNFNVVDLLLISQRDKGAP